MRSSSRAFAIQGSVGRSFRDSHGQRESRTRSVCTKKTPAPGRPVPNPTVTLPAPGCPQHSSLVGTRRKEPHRSTIAEPLRAGVLYVHPPSRFLFFVFCFCSICSRGNVLTGIIKVISRANKHLFISVACSVVSFDVCHAGSLLQIEKLRTACRLGEKAGTQVPILCQPGLNAACEVRVGVFRERDRNVLSTYCP